MSLKSQSVNDLQSAVKQHNTFNSLQVKEEAFRQSLSQIIFDVNIEDKSELECNIISMLSQEIEEIDDDTKLEMDDYIYLHSLLAKDKRMMTDYFQYFYESFLRNLVRCQSEVQLINDKLDQNMQGYRTYIPVLRSCHLIKVDSVRLFKSNELTFPRSLKGVDIKMFKEEVFELDIAVVWRGFDTLGNFMYKVFGIDCRKCNLVQGKDHYFRPMPLYYRQSSSQFMSRIAKFGNAFMTKDNEFLSGFKLHFMKNKSQRQCVMYGKMSSYWLEELFESIEQDDYMSRSKVSVILQSHNWSRSMLRDGAHQVLDRYYYCKCLGPELLIIVQDSSGNEVVIDMSSREAHQRLRSGLNSNSSGIDGLACKDKPIVFACEAIGIREWYQYEVVDNITQKDTLMVARLLYQQQQKIVADNSNESSMITGLAKSQQKAPLLDLEGRDQVLLDKSSNFSKNTKDENAMHDNRSPMIYNVIRDVVPDQSIAEKQNDQNQSNQLVEQQQNQQIGDNDLPQHLIQNLLQDQQKAPAQQQVSIESYENENEVDNGIDNQQIDNEIPFEQSMITHLGSAEKKLLDKTIQFSEVDQDEELTFRLQANVKAEPNKDMLEPREEEKHQGQAQQEQLMADGLVQNESRNIQRQLRSSSEKSIERQLSPPQADIEAKSTKSSRKKKGKR